MRERTMPWPGTVRAASSGPKGPPVASPMTAGAIAGAHSHPGIVVCALPVRVPGISGGGEAGVAQQLLSRVGAEELDEGLGLFPVLTVGDGRGRILVDDLVRAVEVDLLDLTARA